MRTLAAIGMRRPLREPASAWVRGLHMLTLGSFGVAQPLYDLISKNATFLVAHDASAADLLVLVLVLSVGVSGSLLVVQELLRLVSDRAGAMIHLLQVGVLSAVIVSPPLKGISSWSDWLALPVAIGAGAAVAVLYRRVRVFRSWLSLASPAILVFPVVFLFFSPVSKLWGSREVGRSGGTVESVTPVVVVVFDELPLSSLLDENLQIDERRYPAFSSLARDAWWFRNASAVSQATHYAIPAVLTGRYPAGDRLATALDYPDNLFTLLGSGYEQRVVEILSRLCPDDLNSARAARPRLGRRMRALMKDTTLVYAHMVAPQRLTRGLPAIDGTWRDFAGEGEASAVDPRSRWGDSTWVFEHFMDQIRPVHRPTLFFLHLNLPHLPWKYLPSGKEYGPLGASVYPHGLCGSSWCGSEWEVLQGWQRHLLQVAYADRLLGRLLERLRDSGLYHRSLVVVTSDHGASFRVGEGRRPITANNVDDILAIPLLVKRPWQDKGEVSDRNVETIDILPTIAETIEVEVPWMIDGSSVFGSETSERSTKVVFLAEGGRAGERVVFGPVCRGHLETAQRKTAHFGPGKGTEGLFTFGPYRSLVGKQVSAVPSASPAEHRITIEQAGELEDVDPAASFIPAHVVGSLQGLDPADAPAHLAIAVNGVIRACTETFDLRNGLAGFTALLPEEALIANRNRLDVFLIRGTASHPQLSPMRSVPAASCRIVRGPGGEMRGIECSDERRFEVIPGVLSGEWSARGIAVSGWAADLDTGTRAESVLVFRDDEFLFASGCTVRRPDVVRRFGPQSPLRCGFRFVVPEHLRAKEEVSRLHVIAARGGRASEIFRDRLPRPRAPVTTASPEVSPTDGSRAR